MKLKQITEQQAREQYHEKLDYQYSGLPYPYSELFKNFDFPLYYQGFLDFIDSLEDSTVVEGFDTIYQEQCRECGDWYDNEIEAMDCCKNTKKDKTRSELLELRTFGEIRLCN